MILIYRDSCIVKYAGVHVECLFSHPQLKPPGYYKITADSLRWFMIPFSTSEIKMMRASKCRHWTAFKCLESIRWHDQRHVRREPCTLDVFRCRGYYTGTGYQSFQRSDETPLESEEAKLERIVKRRSHVRTTVAAAESGQLYVHPQRRPHTHRHV